MVSIHIHSKPKFYSGAFISHMNEGEFPRTLLKQNDFAVFRCQEAECLDDSFYLAVYDSAAIDRKDARARQSGTPWESPLVEDAGD